MRAAACTRALLHGPYRTPEVSVGDILRCRIRGIVVVGSFSKGRIPWPMTKHRGPGASPAYILRGDLVRAVRCESVAAIRYWFGVGTATITKWRWALGVQRFNEGTTQLYSRWKPRKIPSPRTVQIVPAKLRRLRRRAGLTQGQIAKAMGWSTRTTYEQYEAGRRKRMHPTTLRQIVLVLQCRQADLVA